MKYYVGKTIGAGSFGVVRECVEIASGRTYAVKTISKIPKRGLPTPRYLLKLRTEVEIMQQIGYSLDAVHLKDVFEDDEAVHLVMQLCEGGALLERIESKCYSERYIVQIVRSILRFISQCHAKGFIYRDVKPDNFLFESTALDSPLKATDFGLSIKHWSDEPKLTARSGTPAYMAPELILQLYDEKCDLWSVGMLTYQLLTGRFPFWEDVRHEPLGDVWKAILTRNINWNAQELKQLSRPAVDFLKSLLERDPVKRPSAQQALEHPWIADVSVPRDLPLGGSVVQRLQRFSTYGRLKQMVLKMIVDEMAGTTPASLVTREGVSPSLIAGLQELFEQLDTDHSGNISFEELKIGLKTLGYVLSDSEIELLMGKVDSDHDGSIELSEFITTLIDWNQMQQSKDWQRFIDIAFQKLDEDGDGYISLDEILECLPSVTASTGTRIPEPERLAEAKQMLREADTNGDGKVSKSEFEELLKETHGAPDSLTFYDDRLAGSTIKREVEPRASS